jgi:dTDP-4-dehydrorhamnose 3,5-epimerase
MPQKLIDGVRVKALRFHCDERGRLMELLRCDDECFQKFGQVYLTTAYPGVVKAWHYHRLQTDTFAVVSGMMKMVLFDAREGSETKGLVNEFFLGDWSPILLQIPPGVYHGFKCISEREAIAVNVPTEPYNHGCPDEYRLDPHAADIPYDWTRKDG